MVFMAIEMSLLLEWYMYSHTHTHSTYAFISISTYMVKTISSQLPIPIQHWRIHSSFLPFHMYSSSAVKNVAVPILYIVTYWINLPGVQLTCYHCQALEQLPSYLSWALTPSTRLPFLYPLAGSYFSWLHMTSFRLNYSGKKRKYISIYNNTFYSLKQLINNLWKT